MKAQEVMLACVSIMAVQTGSPRLEWLPLLLWRRFCLLAVFEDPVDQSKGYARIGECRKLVWQSDPYGKLR